MNNVSHRQNIIAQLQAILFGSICDLYKTTKQIAKVQSLY